MTSPDEPGAETGVHPVGAGARLGVSGDPALRTAVLRTSALRTASYFVGVGARRGVTADELDALIDAALTEAGLVEGWSAGVVVRGLATSVVKAAEPGIRAVAARRGWLLVTFTTAELAAEPVPHPSELVRGVLGTSSVAEAAACRAARAAGGGADLVVPKRCGPGSTVAVARAVAPIRSP